MCWCSIKKKNFDEKDVLCTVLYCTNKCKNAGLFFNLIQAYCASLGEYCNSRKGFDMAVGEE